MDPNKQPGVTIGQIVLERLRFEHRDDYLALSPKTDIKDLPIALTFQVGLVGDKSKGLLRVRARTPEGANALYAFDLTLVALLEVKAGEANMPLERYATVSGVSLLYPFLREAVANLTQRGRFGPVWLAPLNVVAAVETAQVSVEPVAASVPSPPARAQRPAKHPPHRTRSQ